MRWPQVPVTPRRLFIGALASGALTAPAAAQAAQRVWRIGYLGTVPAGTAPESDRILAVFTRGLRDDGYVEGQNIVVEWRFLEGRTDQLPAVIAELIGLPVDVLVVVPAAAVRTAAQATTTIPIVAPLMPDPVAQGLVASLARPGANLTGLTTYGDDLYPKRLELLKAIAPRAVRVAFIQPNYVGRLDARRARALSEGYAEAARRLGISLHWVPLQAAQDLDAATATIVRERVEAIVVGDSAISYLVRREIADFAIRRRLPAIVAHRSALAGGALMSYGPDLADNWRKAADYVARILKDAKPAELPIERPTKVELVINRKTAKVLGLTIPQALLLQADEVIE